MTIFDAEDWQQLESEIMELYNRSLPPQEFQKELSGILHEWAESAVAIGSPELAEASKPDTSVETECNALADEFDEELDAVERSHPRYAPMVEDALQGAFDEQGKTVERHDVRAWIKSLVNEENES